jgi:hypothetical protein
MKYISIVLAALCLTAFVSQADAHYRSRGQAVVVVRGGNNFSYGYGQGFRQQQFYQPQQFAAPIGGGCDYGAQGFAQGGCVQGQGFGYSQQQFVQPAYGYSSYGYSQGFRQRQVIVGGGFGHRGNVRGVVVIRRR